MPASTLAPELKDTTHLVRALLNFGLKDAAGDGSDLDGEDEEVTVGGVLGKTQTTKDDPASSKKKAAKQQQKQKGKEKEKDVAEEMEALSLGGAGAGGAGATAGAEGGAIPAGKVKDKNLKGLLRHSDHTITLPSDKDGGEPTERVLTSWKMADFAYKRDPCPFPTRARGLFTEKVEGAKLDGGDVYRIVARGYDKFFNVGEVSWTQWDNISKHSSPPYELTQKSNGCIILIAALSPSHILVTSKHSIGAHAQVNTESGKSHSQMGEYWLEKHLAKVGKTKADLANELWEKELTAVAELCDDSFEEHVLAYPPHLTGLHLHGLNHNTTTLNTLPSSAVTTFAKTWGFIPTPFVTFPSVVGVKTYCESVEAAGGVEEPTKDGKGVKLVPVEGFVVRGVKKGGEKGEAFFWKVKYDQPYLMYREWRELTRRVLASYPNNDVKPNKLKNEESRMYLWWVNFEIQKDVSRFDSWKTGKGIIRTREEFLKWMKGKEAKEVARSLKNKAFTEVEMDAGKDFDKTLIVPVAVQGCGKTALALALAKLFGWGHTQSDDFIMKKSGPHFIKSVRELLGKNQVVIADKNNHIRKLRTDLVEVAQSAAPAHKVRLVALVWPVDSPEYPRDKLHALCASRIVTRGQNHQTLRAGEGHENALWQFFGQHEAFEPATNKEDGAFHEVIEMKHDWTKKEALEHVVEKMVGILGVAKPSDKEIEEALEFADGYKPTVFKQLTDKEREKLEEKKKPRYYGIAVEARLFDVLSPVFAPGSNETFDAISKAGRIEQNPHVTLVHEVELQSSDEEFKKAKKELWDHYVKTVEGTKTAGADSVAIEVTLGPRVVYDSRAMSIEVSNISSKVDGVLRLEGKKSAHVTVGTLENDIRPVEGKLLFDALADGKTESEKGGEIHVKEMEVVKCRGVLKGLR
ncbi:tRNA ligase [Pseudohyphozyma bogoriensis]|nr:tRNA ligase [Pseudohyphozyma bogoriensis]